MSTKRPLPPLLQLVQDNTRGDRQHPAVRSEDAGDAVHLYLSGVIDPFWGLNAPDLISALAVAGGRDVTMHINSPGGDVFESLSMAAAVAGYAGRVTASVEGMAASAATRLALSASQVTITAGSLWMIHNSWTMAWGNKAELRTTADLLEKVDAGIAADYMRKTGATLQQVTEWMDAETWFTAEEAAAAGFVDQVLVASQSTAAQASWNLSVYRNAPTPAAPSPSPDALAEQARRQAQLNRARLAALALPI